MQLETREMDQVLIVDLKEPELNHVICNEFQRRIMSLVDNGMITLLLNLGSVQFLDSCGIGTLITIRNKLLKVKGAIARCNISERVQKVRDIAALHKVFDIYETEEDALADLAA